MNEQPKGLTKHNTQEFIQTEFLTHTISTSRDDGQRQLLACAGFQHQKALSLRRLAAYKGSELAADDEMTSAAGRARGKPRGPGNR